MSGNAISRVPAAVMQAGGMELFHTIFAAVSNNDTLRMDETSCHFSPQHLGIPFPLYFTNWT